MNGKRMTDDGFKIVKETSLPSDDSDVSDAFESDCDDEEDEIDDISEKRGVNLSSGKRHNGTPGISSKKSVSVISQPTQSIDENIKSIIEIQKELSSDGLSKSRISKLNKRLKKISKYHHNKLNKLLKNKTSDSKILADINQLKYSIKMLESKQDKVKEDSCKKTESDASSVMDNDISTELFEVLEELKSDDLSKSRRSKLITRKCRLEKAMKPSESKKQSLWEQLTDPTTAKGAHKKRLLKYHEDQLKKEPFTPEELEAFKSKLKPSYVKEMQKFG